MEQREGREGDKENENEEDGWPGMVDWVQTLSGITTLWVYVRVADHYPDSVIL
jgi:hypothetical protein